MDFAYPSRPHTNALDQFSLKVGAGESCALVGSSGGGKSTAVQLLERFYDPQGGTVSIDGTNIKELNVKWLRDQMGLVSQTPVV